MKGGVEIERHRVDDNSGRGSFKPPNLEDTIHPDDLLAAYDKEIAPHVGMLLIIYFLVTWIIRVF